MKKLALFVEGQTEQIFAEQLLYYMAGDHGISIEKRRGFGGRSNGRSFITLSSPESSSPFYILLVDSSNDGRVLSDIRDEYDSLTQKGYDKIIGLRDIYPYRHKDFRKLKKVVRQLLPKGEVKSAVCFAVLEIETWFIAEYTHFKKIHPRLTPEFIFKQTGIDPRSLLLETELIPEKDELLNSPAKDLNRIYKLVKRAYNKKKQQVKTLIKILNFDIMTNELPKHMQSLAYFLRELNEFFDSVTDSTETGENS